MKYKLQDLIDIEQFQMLQDRLNEIYPFPSAIIDNDGNILTATAWQDVCTQFHRKNKECEQECVQSDQYILGHLAEARPAVSYRCPHGLADNAIPIIIDGDHYGNFFTGQFFMEPPNLEYFKQQAQKYGFDETAYLKAVRSVPIWNQAQLNSYLLFIQGLIEVISNCGLKNLREAEARRKIEETEKRADTILHQMLDAFWVIDLHGNILDVNPAMCQLTGYPRDELLSMSIADVIATDSPAVGVQRIQDIVQIGSAQFESQFRHKDGPIIDVDIRITHLPERGVLFGFHRDITERKRAEEALRESEDLFKYVFDHSMVGKSITKLTGEVRVNLAFCDMLGYTPEEFKARKWQETTHPDDIELTQREINALASGAKQAAQFTKRFIHKNGSVIWVDLRSSLRRDIDGKPLYLMTSMVDITERKRAEEALRASEEKYRTVADFTHDWEYWLSPDGTYVYVSPSCERVTGYRAEEFQADPDLLQRIIYPEDRKLYSHHSPHMETHTIDQGFDFRITTRKGEERWFSHRCQPVYDNQGKYQGQRGSNRDITERKRVEEELRASEEKFSKVFQLSPALMALSELKDGCFIDVNDTFLNTLGFERQEIIGKSSLALGLFTDPQQRTQAQRLLLTEGQFRNLEVTISPKFGTPRVGLFSGVLLPLSGKQTLLTMMNDITERKQAEELIKKALAEKETLLRELYHRTKNNMGVINALLDLQASYFHDDRLQKAFEETQNRIHAMALVHQKLYETSDLSHINLKEYISDLSQLLLGSYLITPGQVSVVSDMQDIFVLIDTAIPCGLILNELISNTLKYAFPGGRTGRLKLQLHHLENGGIQLGVSDDGVGLPPGFDPQRDGRMGMQTIFALAENQLQAQINFLSEGGVSCKLQFKDDLYQPRI